MTPRSYGSGTGLNRMRQRLFQWLEETCGMLIPLKPAGTFQAADRELP